MKPNFETVEQIKNRGLRDGRGFPATDYNYQSVALGGYGYNSGCARAEIPSFRNISRDYFKNEAPQNFIGEASFFVMMVLTAAAGVAASAYALADFVRAIGGV